jgi:putative transposase
MPSTHINLLCHAVFSTRERQPSIELGWKDRLHAYLGGTARSLGAVPLVVGGVADHVHLLLSLRATHRLSDLMREIKHESSRWVHDEIGAVSFAWQEGYGAFSVSSREVSEMRRYIEGQEEHDRIHTFQEEYLTLLEEHDLEFDERYLW